MARHLKNRYGSDVAVDYYDFADSRVQERESAMIRSVQEHNWPLPVVAINGEVKFKGFIGFWAIVEAIEATRQPQQVS